jgi:hypothetical protein
VGLANSLPWNSRCECMFLFGPSQIKPEWKVIPGEFLQFPIKQDALPYFRNVMLSDEILGDLNDLDLAYVPRLSGLQLLQCRWPWPLSLLWHNSITRRSLDGGQ